MKRISGLVVLLAMVACSPYNYYTSKSQNADFSHYKTYGWLPGLDSLSKSYYDNAIAEDNIIETTNKELAARGLTYTKDNPDLLFRYKAIVNNTSRRFYEPAYYGWGGYGWGFSPWWGYSPWGWGGGFGWGGAVGRERYRAGHIILEAIDANSRKIVWQGRGSGEVDNPEKAVNDLPVVVSNIMKSYPITASK